MRNEKKEGLSRAKAERLIASTCDVNVLTPLTDHKNKHVSAKAKHKLGTIADRSAPEPETDPETP
jgi:hypothetical protein